jgi:hypothetical protein
METTFGVLDAIAFFVFALLTAVAVILIVSLGQLPGQVAREWGGAAAVNVASWLGLTRARTLPAESQDDRPVSERSAVADGSILRCQSGRSRLVLS